MFEEYGNATIPPSIDTLPASNVAKNSARLNGSLTFDQSDNETYVRFGYGTTSKAAGAFATYDTLTANVSWNAVSSPYLDITGLTANTTYYYRVQASNTYSANTSPTERSFTTSINVDPVTSFYGIPSSTSISLTWTKGAGATNTLVRYSTITYPTGTTNGTSAYFGTGSSNVTTGLTAGTTYYFTAYGESGGGYTAATYLAVTTLATDDSGDNIENPTMSSWWNQTPSGAGLSGLEPFYTIGNGMSEALGFPSTGTFWLSLNLLWATVLGLVVYVKMHSPSGGIIVLIAVTCLGVALKTTPGYVVAIEMALSLGMWAAVKDVL